jgi:Holliday junction resolvasome RuvABC endonuclease subunit
VTIVAGIDSAETSGIVILDRSRIVRRGVCVVSGWADVERAADAIGAFSPDLVVIEDCFVRANASTGIALAKLVGKWEQAFGRRGIPTAAVLASTWQPVILGGRISARARRAERKAACVQWAQERFGLVLDEDLADDAAIATWGLKYALPGISGVHGRPRPTVATEPVASADAIRVRTCPKLSGLGETP